MENSNLADLTANNQRNQIMRLKITGENWMRARDMIAMGGMRRVTCCPVALAFHGEPLTSMCVGGERIVCGSVIVKMPAAMIEMRERFDSREPMGAEVEFSMSAERFIP